MTLILLTAILMLGLATRRTEATFPGIFLLPFMSSHKLVHKVSSTQPPSPALFQSQITTEIPVQHQNDFVKLHKWLEQTQQSTYVSRNKDEKGKEHQIFHSLEATQPQPQLLRQMPETVTPYQQQHIPSSEVQVAALATNHGPPQRSPVYHQQHQPVPLTFPPTSTGSTDANSSPKIISLPPLLPPQSQQHLPQSSSHYTTSSLSYSFAQGYRQGYGPPKSTKIVRHVSVFVSPELPYNSQNRQKIRVQGDAEKHVNIIFIKSPDSSKSSTAEIELPPSPEQKTYVYVLNKAQEGPGNVVVNTPEPPKYNPPDVFFINYKGGPGQQNQYGVPPQQSYGVPQEQQQHGTPPSQYGSPPSPPSQHGSPPSQYGSPQPPQTQYGSPQPPQSHYGSPQPPQTQYGSPQPPQSHYGSPQPPQTQYGSPQPPQSQYGSPPQQQHNINPTQQNIPAPTTQQSHQQKQPPSLEYVAPSNQKFNYTLPLSISLPYSLVVNSKNNPLKNVNVSNSFVSLSNGQLSVTKRNQTIEADRRFEENAYYHTYHSNYDTSDQSYGDYWQSKEDHGVQVKLPQDLSQRNNNNLGLGETGNGLYSQASQLFDGINKSHMTNGTNRELLNLQQVTIQLETSPTTPQTTEKASTKTGATVSYFPATTTRPLSPSTPNVKYYTPVANTPNGQVLFFNHNASFGESNNSNKIDNANKVGDNGNDIRDNITMLTKRNVTTITSGDLVDDNVKKKEKGSPRNISGRPDDFRLYKYAPSMGYEYFGISGYKVIS